MKVSFSLKQLLGSVWVYESSVCGPIGIVVQDIFHLAKGVTILNLFPAADYRFLSS